jgi:hypothetical protein
VADVPADAPGDTTRKLTPEALAAWERSLAETRERNLARLAPSVAAQRAEIAAAKEPMLARARARAAAEIAGIADHRAQARAWAAAHPDAGDRLEEMQAEARAKSEPPT